MDPQHMAEQKQDDQLELTYSSYVRIRDVALKTCLRRWTIGRSGESGSGISVLAERHDEDYYCSHQGLLVVFTGVRKTASLLKSPGLFLMFWLISTML